jgi:hypothetical protein
MPLTVLAEGFVTRRRGSGHGAVAAGPRAAVLGDEVLCSCMLTSALGTNDFVPVLFRSSDSGSTWLEQGPIWPHLRERWSIFVSISRDTTGKLFVFGTRTPIQRAGESFWSEATQGLLQNELVWAQSDDGGRTWTEPAVVRMPIPGAAEAPGALCCLRRGRWLAPYSPYNTFDPRIAVERNQVIVVSSDDQGRSWNHTAMLHFDDPLSGACEAWAVELSDGRLLGTAWHLSYGDAEHPNAYALSHDGGSTWGPTRSTGSLGQSTALAALPDGRALFIRNQRRHGEPGVWLAVVRPTDRDFGVETDEIVWRAHTRTQTGTSGGHNAWSDFSFGEPSVIVLPDSTLLVTLWSIQPSGRGIEYVLLKHRP